jgi:4-carboxymuconolactone decarboxylase
MTAEQRTLHDTIAAQRSGGQVRGPFAVLLHAPDVGGRIADMVNHLLSDTRVAHTLKELAIIVVARQYTAQYEWYVHARRAKEVGLDPAAIDAIRHRRRPDFSDENEALVYDMTLEIVERRRLGDEHYARAVAALGEPAVVELVALIGFYIGIAVFLVSFDVEVPDAGAELLVDRGR